MAKNEFYDFEFFESDVEYNNESPQENYHSEVFGTYKTKLENIRQQTSTALFNIFFTQQSKSHQKEMVSLYIKNLEELIEETNSIRKKLINIFTQLDEQGNYKENIKSIEEYFENIDTMVKSLQNNINEDIEKLKFILKTYV